MFYGKTPDHIQNRRIKEANDNANSVVSKANRVQSELDKLQNNFDKMSLLNQALWEIIQEKLGVSDADLEAKILEIDLRDGKADGKMGGSITNCPNCERKVNARTGRCLYCGAELEQENHKFQL